MKKIYLFAMIAISLLLVSCANQGTNQENTTETLPTVYTTESINVSEIISDDVNFDQASWEDYQDTDSQVIDGTSTNFTITEEGTYLLQGTITESIIVDLADDEDVRLILDNVTISPTENAAIIILSADDVVISVLEDTINYLSDSETYQTAYTDYNAVIYSTADLAINGEGTLIIDASSNNAIQTKDDLVIVDTTIEIMSVDDGIVGRDSLLIQNASLTIEADGDGLKTTNDESPDKGYLYIESGTFNLTVGSDGIDAVNDIVIDDGNFTIISEKKGIKSDASIYLSNGTYSVESTEDAIDADGSLTVQGGTYDLQSDEDAVHVNENVNLSQSDFTIQSVDDGIHADNELVIHSGNIVILSAFEGLEGKAITIQGGYIDIHATDDGINASDPDVEVIEGPNVIPNASTSTGTILISGGTLIIESEDDGIDANGTFTMTGGNVFINGPTSGLQSAIDFDLEWIQSGGLLIAVAGYGNETKFPSTGSTQTTLVYNLTNVQPANQLISLISEDIALYTFTPLKSYQVVYISSPDLNQSTTYTLAVGGSSSVSSDAIYETQVEVTNATTIDTFTLDDIINTFNLDSSSTTFPPHGPGRP